MDPLIARFDAVKDRDLMLALGRGVAYQRDMSTPIDYGDAYFKRYVDLEGKEIAQKINAGRIELVNDYVGADGKVLDVGVGSGEFIKNRPNTCGFDINPVAIEWLKREGKFSSNLSDFSAFTFWDVLEHVENPDRSYFRNIPDGAYFFTCLPIFDDLNKVRESRHYKPNEHFYYWTPQGLIDWMAFYRFRHLETRDFETTAGRDNILSFAFVRDLPGYHETVDQYRQIYEPNYGMSAYLYFDKIAQAVKSLNPGSILDYGCGHSDLVAHFWLDGRRRIEKYDPAVPQFKKMPDGQFDLVICCDVMEHILFPDIGRVLGEIKEKSRNAVFTISMKPARAKLPDGRNAHVSLLTETEWTRWIRDVFGQAHRVRVHDDKILMLKTFG